MLNFTENIVSAAHTKALQRFAPGDANAYTISSALHNTPNDQEVKDALLEKLNRIFAMRYLEFRSLSGHAPYVPCDETISILAILQSSEYFNDSKRERFANNLSDRLAYDCDIYSSISNSPGIFDFFGRKTTRVCANVSQVFLDINLSHTIASTIASMELRANLLIPEDALSQTAKKQIMHFIDEAGCTILASDCPEIALSQPCFFIKPSLTNKKHVFETPLNLIKDGWERNYEETRQLTENFVGTLCSSRLERGMQASLTLTIPTAIPLVSNTGIATDSTREIYEFNCNIHIQSMTGRWFYQPPNDIKDRLDRLAHDDNFRHLMHYVDFIFVGGEAYISIRFTSTSKRLAQNAHAKLSTLTDVGMVLEAYSKLQKNGMSLQVNTITKGFDKTSPAYTGNDPLSYYQIICNWVQENTITTPTILGFHARPVSYIRLGQFNQIKHNYIKLAIENYRNQIAIDSGLKYGGVENVTEQLNNILKQMADNHVLLPKEDLIHFRDLSSAGDYLNIDSNNKMNINTSVPACSFRLMPVDDSELLSVNSGNFYIQVLRDRTVIGYLIAESAGTLNSHYRLCLHPQKVKEEYLYWFQLRDTLSSHSNSTSPLKRKITAAPPTQNSMLTQDVLENRRLYKLVAPAVSSRNYCSPEIGDHVLCQSTNGKGCFFAPQGKSVANAHSVNFWLDFANTPYIERLNSLLSKNNTPDEDAIRAAVIHSEQNLRRFGHRMLGYGRAHNEEQEAQHSSDPQMRQNVF